MQNKTLKISILLLFGLGFVFSLCIFLPKNKVQALDNLEEEISSYQSEIDALNAQIESQQASISDLDAKINTYEENIKAKHNEILTLNNQVSILDDDLGKNQAELDKKTAEIELLQLEIERLRAKIDESNRNIETYKSTLGTYLQEIYQADQKTFLEKTLVQDSLSSYSSEVEYLKNIRKQFQETLDKVQKLKSEMLSQKQEEGDKKEELEIQKEHLSVRQSSIESERTYKAQLLEQVQGQEEDFQSLVAQIRNEKSSMDSQIASLAAEYNEKWAILQQKQQEKDQQDSTIDPGIIDPGTPEDLPTVFDPEWPVVGEITCVFHCPDYPFRAIFEHPGLDVAVSYGTPVAAADSGYVSIAHFDGTTAYAFVTIMHAEGYGTVYGHLSNVVVTADQYVTKGDIIGYSGGVPGTPGCGNYSTGAHLHFEVRADGKIPVDPLLYLP